MTQSNVPLSAIAEEKNTTENFLSFSQPGVNRVSPQDVCTCDELRAHRSPSL